MKKGALNGAGTHLPALKKQELTQKLKKECLGMWPLHTLTKPYWHTVAAKQTNSESV